MVKSILRDASNSVRKSLDSLHTHSTDVERSDGVNMQLSAVLNNNLT